MPNTNKPKRFAQEDTCPVCGETHDILLELDTSPIGDGYVIYHGYCKKCRINFENFYGLKFDELGFHVVANKGLPNEEYYEKFFDAGEEIVIKDYEEVDD